PHPGAVVELVEVGGWTIQLDLLEERLLVVAERPLHLPLPGGITRRAGDDFDLMVGGELDRRRMQAEPFPRRLAQRSHPVDPHPTRDPTRRFEEPDHPLKRVLAVERRGEPDGAPPRPTQDTTQTEQLVVPTPADGPVGAVRPIQLRLLARA